MSFGKNIQFLRKKENMTQEELAEKMGVSRQTVSKWESDAAFPETDKIMQLCGMFSCDMDTLMRGDIEESTVLDTEEYDRHYNGHAKAIALGCALVLLGVTFLLTFIGFGVNESISTMVMLSFIVVAVAVFIISGINHDNYVKKHPYIKPFYKDEEIENFTRRFPFFIALPTVLILIGVIWTVGYDVIPVPFGLSKDRWDSLFVVPLMLLITIAVPIYVYAGIQKNKYDIDAYNREHKYEQEKEANAKAGKWGGCIMLAATAVFLLMGFLGNLWYISWIVFPIGGIICGIVSTIYKKV